MWKHKTGLALIFTTLIGGAIAGSGLVVFPSSTGSVTHASDRRACSASLLAGPYGYAVTGTLYLGTGGTRQVGGSPVPVNAVGVVSFDGSGRLTTAETASLAGHSERREQVGRYTVQADCTGTASLYFGSPPFASELSFVVTDQGRGLAGVTTDAGATVLLTATRQ